MRRVQKSNCRTGVQELRKALMPNAGAFAVVVIFGVFVNILMLTGPLFMLQVYDRVLTSRSEETLVALLLLVVILYAIMGVLDYARGRVAARIGASFQAGLDRQVFEKAFKSGGTGLRDLESIQRLLSSAALFSLLDIPWTPIFIAAIFVFHPSLGWLALGGGGLLILIAGLNRSLTSRMVNEANRVGLESDFFADSMQARQDTVRGLGMEATMTSRWQNMRQQSLEMQVRSSDRLGVFATLGRTLRLFLQSAVLALGAYLVLQGQMTSGGMIAASVLTGRALAPVEQTIGQWPIIQRARLGWQNLASDGALFMPTLTSTQLPKPRAYIEVKNLSVVMPESRAPSLRSIEFSLQPGQVLGVIGPSGSGKSTLARALTGIWPASAGSVRLDGAELDQYGTSLGKHIGYLPQEVRLFEATVAENIARMSESPDAEMVLAAAKSAGAHDMILRLAKGYDTKLYENQTGLSGGEMQRIGLARALFGAPALLVLDEPNANLDAEGSIALNLAIRRFKEAGNVAIIMAHRPSGIRECDFLMVLKDGRCTAFGPREEVLGNEVRNHTEINQTIGAKGRI